MTEMQSEEAARASAREDHISWIRSQQADFAARAERSGAGSDLPDFAVGNCEAFDDAEPVYRSLSLAGPSQDAFEYEEEPVYRSIDMGKLAVSADSLPSPSATEAEWLKQKRPPLLRRQNAFAFADNHDPAWLGLLGGSEDQQSGR